MINLKLNAIAVAIGIALSAGAMAQDRAANEDMRGDSNETKMRMGATPGKSDADYAAAKAKCETLPGDARSNCMTDLMLKFGKSGPDMPGGANMNANQRGMDGRAGRGKSDADFSAAKAKCDALPGDAKSNCMTDLMLKFGKSGPDTLDKPNMNADQRSSNRRNSPSAGKSDSDFAAAKAKCEALQGDARSNCMSEVTLRFGKS